MTEHARDPRTSKRTLWLVGGVLALLVFLLLNHMKTVAPRRIDLFTGPAGSSYHALGEAFQRALKPKGIKARVIETRGALDNLERLIQADGPALAFAESNVEQHLEDKDVLETLTSLGSLAFEPLWIFTREDMHAKTIRSLEGRRVAIGPVGSGSRAIGEFLLEASGLKGRVTTTPFDALANEDAADALLSGQIDAVFVVSSTRSATVSRLLRADGVSPLSMYRGATYAILFPGLAPFEVPTGIVDLVEDIPDEPLHTLAATTNMVVRRDLHGAMVEALVDVAGSSQPRPSLESPDGVFPSPKYVSLPLDPRARRFYKEGPSKLSRYVPYWASALVNQFVIVVLPALAVLFTVLKIVPATMGLKFKLRNLALTRRMVQVERRLIEGEDPDVLLAALREIDSDSARLRVPASHAAKFLELRQNLHDARERTEARHPTG